VVPFVLLLVGGSIVFLRYRKKQKDTELESALLETEDKKDREEREEVQRRKEAAREREKEQRNQLLSSKV
jgi:cytochrome c-type biogenesis protein CcmH/NrfF